MENNPNLPEQENPVEVDKVDNPQEQVVSVSEMKRRIAKLEEKHTQNIQEAVQQTLEKYKAENELTGKELEDYRKREAEQEKQKLQDRIAELEREQTRRKLTDEAIKTLSTRKLPVNDKVLSFVVKDTAEDTLNAISDLEAIITEIKSEFTQTEAPKVSSNFNGGESQSRADVFRSARILK